MNVVKSIGAWADPSHGYVIFCFCGHRLSAKSLVECTDISLIALFCNCCFWDAYDPNVLIQIQICRRPRFSLLEISFFWRQLCGITVEINRHCAVCFMAWACNWCQAVTLGAASISQVLFYTSGGWLQTHCATGAQLEFTMKGHVWLVRLSQAQLSCCPLGSCTCRASLTIAVTKWETQLSSWLRRALCYMARACAWAVLTGGSVLSLACIREAACFSALHCRDSAVVLWVLQWLQVLKR